MRIKLNKLLQLTFFLILCKENIFAQNQGYVIDYYGIVSTALDNNMATMISDLYYTQLSEIPNFIVYDKRETPSSTSVPDFFSMTASGNGSGSAKSKNFIFYAEIIKDENNEDWGIIFNIVDSSKQQRFSKQKHYDSFYKILMGSKNELKDTVKDLLTGRKSEVYQNDFEPQKVKSVQGRKTEVSSVERLSGTWKVVETESYIDKIVILRGGRGFIIFNNGASMNISINIENIDNEQVIHIKQKGNSNASFYPELPRKIALEAAISAPPMEWKMQLLDTGYLKGIKTSIAQEGESFSVSNIPVSWKKQ